MSVLRKSFHCILDLVLGILKWLALGELQRLALNMVDEAGNTSWSTVVQSLKIDEELAEELRAILDESGVMTVDSRGLCFLTDHGRRIRASFDQVHERVATGI